MSKIALITGITGQDGWYMADLLSDLGAKGEAAYGVIYGVMRPGSKGQIPPHLTDVIECDLTDSQSVAKLLGGTNPDEIYNFAAQTHVGQSFKNPGYTMEVNTVGLINLLEIVRLFQPATKVYQASSSEMFGVLQEGHPATEDFAFRPVSPYGVSKLAAHHIAKVYRRQGVFVSTGICFNHESPRRGKGFVTRKICQAVADYKMRFIKQLELGDLTAVRDWGDAREYVAVMQAILQHDQPDDFVIATGETASVSDWLAYCCEIAEIDRIPIVHPDHLIRPVDIPWLCGDATKLERVLNYKIKHNWQDVCQDMMETELGIAGDKARVA